MAPKQFKLNVGGTRYEVSDALLDRFPNSMLRKITSDRWNESDDGGDNNDDSDHIQEIFIERNGGRFQIILDYMRDGQVVLPLSIPRLQLISDMEYYGIDFDESKIILDVADESNDIFHTFSEFIDEKRRFKNSLEPKRKALEVRYRGLAAESMSCRIAAQFFKEIFSNSVRSTFGPNEIILELSKEPIDDYRIEDLQPHLNRYGVEGHNLHIGRNLAYYEYENFLIINVSNRKMGATNSIHAKREEMKKETKNKVCDETPTKRKVMPKRIKLNVGGTRYEVSDSLLDRFQDSMLRKIISNKIPRNQDENKEICIKRDGRIFEFVLDYMRDGKVVIPVSVQRPQLISDMEYYGIGFDESQITLSVADRKDTFHKMSEYYCKTERFKKKFESILKDVDVRFRALAAESVSCAIASDYFEQQLCAMSSFTFEEKTMCRNKLRPKEQYNYSIEELQPYLNLYGLDGWGIEQRKKEYKRPYFGEVETSYTRVEEPTYIELRVKML